MPESAAQDESDGSLDVLKANPERNQRFDDWMDPLLSAEVSPADSQSNQKTIQKSASSTEVLRRLGVLSSGGESGRWGGGRLSLRGYPGSEPTVSLDGVPLTSGFTGAHAEELIPIEAIARIRVYPFFPSLGIPHAGVGGGYDLGLMTGPQSEKKSQVLSVESPSAISVGGRDGSHCTDETCLQFSWNSGFYRGSQRLIDDRNTPQDASDDVIASVKLKQVDRISTAVQLHSELGNGSRSDTALVLGGENRGTSGLPMTSVSEWNRLLRRLLFVSERLSYLSPATGLNASVQLSARQENANYSQDLKNSSQTLRIDRRREHFQSLNGLLSLPLSESENPHRGLLHLSVERNSISSAVSLAQLQSSLPVSSAPTGPADSTLAGELQKFNSGVGILFAASDSDVFKIETTLHVNQFSLRRTCGVFSPAVLCIDAQHSSSDHSVDGVADWRHRIADSLLLFLQAGRLSRPPSPVEISGRPDGILANPSLVPESTLAAELGLESKFGGIHFFVARDKNLITAEQVSPFLLRYENTSEVQRYGASLEVDLTLFGFAIHTEIEKNASEIRQGRVGQRVLPFVPSEVFRGSIGKSLSIFAQEQIGPRVYAELELERSWDYWLDFQGMSRLRPPSIASLRLSTPWQLSAGSMEMSLVLRNLFDNNQSFLSLPGQPSPRPVSWSSSPVLPVEGRTLEFNLRLLNR